MADVLIIDESEILRELLGRILEVHGYAARWTSLTDARRMLRQEPPALVILEPGPIGSRGWGLLTELSQARLRGRGPQIAVITDFSGKPEVLRAAHLGVRDYMLKRRFSVAELLIRVRRHIAPSRAPRVHDESLTDVAVRSAVGQAAGGAAAPPVVAGAAPVLAAGDDPEAVRALALEMNLELLTKEQTAHRLESAPVQTLPGVVSELIMLVSSPRGTIADIAEILRRDPVLAARVLRIANSAAFSSNRARIATVEDAVKNIGVEGVRNLVINVGLFDAFAAGAAGGLNITHLWQHSLGVAMLMEKLAPKDDSVPPGSAYLVGLCHDLAEMILRQHFAREYEIVDMLVQRSGCRPRLAMAVAFGIPYAELVSRLLTQLRLPPIITVPIEEFFDRGDRKGAGGAGSLLSRTLRAMNVYAHGLLLAPGVDEPLTPLTRTECTNTFGDAAIAPPDDDALRSEALATAAVIAHLNDDQTRQMCEPIVPKHPLRIGYCRHSEYSDLDPLAPCLRLMTREMEKMPALSVIDPNTMEGMNALVIAGPRTNASETFSRDMVTLRRLLLSRPMPVLYLAGFAAQIPTDPQITVQRLPITIQALGGFLGRAAMGTHGAALPAA